MNTVYEERPDDFEQHAMVSAYNALYDRPAMIRLLGQVDGQTVLDAGCGPGLYAEELLDRGATVIAFDSSRGMVELARRRLGSRATLRAHDLAEPLTWLDDQSVDAVVLALVIHHLDDRVAALRELRRVLRPGGRLVLSTHHPTDDWLRLGGSYFEAELVEEVWHGNWNVRYWRQSLTATCAEVADAGFLIERVVEPQPDPAMATSHPDTWAKLVAKPGSRRCSARSHPLQNRRVGGWQLRTYKTTEASQLSRRATSAAKQDRLPARSVSRRRRPAPLRGGQHLGVDVDGDQMAVAGLPLGLTRGRGRLGHGHKSVGAALSMERWSWDVSAETPFSVAPANSNAFRTISCLFGH